VAQQALFAQQPGLHASGPGVFATMHGAAGNRTVAANSTSPTARDTVTLPNITLPNSIIITAGRIGTGKAFFDVGHSLKDHRSNRRSHLPGYAAWEIHPVMKLTVQ
jgi:hypothetical protein